MVDELFRQVSGHLARAYPTQVMALAAAIPALAFGGARGVAAGRQRMTKSDVSSLG